MITGGILGRLLPDISLAEGWREGLEQGVKALIELCQESSFSRDETLTRLVQKLSLSPETAKSCLEKYWRCGD